MDTFSISYACVFKIRENYCNIYYAKTTNLKADTFCECVRNARTEMVERPDPVLPTLPMSADLSDVHYTFDYSQAVSIPHHVCQVGPLNFATPRKVQ